MDLCGYGSRYAHWGSNYALIREPAPKQASVQVYSTWDYLRLVLVFGLAVSGFVGTFLLQQVLLIIWGH